MVRILFFMLSGIILLSSCQKSEIAAPNNQQPIANTIQYRFQENNIMLGEGQGKKVDFGTTYLIATSTMEINCEDGSYQAIYRGVGDNFSLKFQSPGIDAEATLSRMNNGHQQAMFNQNVYNLNLSSSSPIITIIEETKDFIRGTIEDEFFVFNFPLIEPFDTIVNWQSVGIIQAEFSVPMERCE